MVLYSTLLKRIQGNHEEDSLFVNFYSDNETIVENWKFLTRYDRAKIHEPYRGGTFDCCHVDARKMNCLAW